MTSSGRRCGSTARRWYWRGSAAEWRRGADGRTLAECERVLGADHPQTLTSRHNLGGAYYAAERLGEVTPLYERTLADRERVLGADHPDTLRTRAALEDARAMAVRLRSRGDSGPGRS